MVSILNLEHLPADFTGTALYENVGKNEAFNEFQQLVSQSRKFVFITPEYNGSFPGVVKAFIDGLKFPESFRGKKGALVGISSGTQGGALAMGHLSDILNYLGMYLIPIRPRLPLLEDKMQNGTLTDKGSIDLLREQADELIGF